MENSKEKILNFTVIVGALGYFVDIYDLLLFGIVRVPSLVDLGITKEALLPVGLNLLNMQMAGMLLGGIIWGVIGDKRGRISVLFGSIFLYSLANIANAYVQTIPQYAILRFLAGIGLAGELGAAITLVSETMSKENRGYGTAIVAAVGILGAVVGALIGDHFHWKTAYIIGGILGFLLLILRMSVLESGLFNALKSQAVSRGKFFQLFQSKTCFIKYFSCILIGIPIWYVIGILITFSPELSQELDVLGPIAASKSIMYAYIGLAFGDFLSGMYSQILKSRKKVLFQFIVLNFIFVLAYCYIRGTSPTMFYFICALLGFSTGYWAVFVTNASEQFGTNLRATVTTTVPNFVRGSVLLLTMSFRRLNMHVSLIDSALLVGAAVTLIALIALWFLQESFGKDLNFIEVT